MREEPGDGELSGVVTALARERFPTLELLEVLVAEIARSLSGASEARVRRGCDVALVLPGQESSRERKERHERYAERGTGRQHLTLHAPLDEAVLHLRGRDRRPAASLR